MTPSQWPSWLLIAFGVVAVVAGVLGVVHAPPAVAKVFWSVVTVAGLVSLASCGRRTRRRGASR